MEERKACARLRLRFEQAGFHIAENVPFDEDGVRLELDGFDAGNRVGYEYVTAEAGDGWDVDADVIAELAARHQRGGLHVLVVAEADAPDEAALDTAAAAFLAELRTRGVTATTTAAARPPAKKPAAPPAKKPAAPPAKKPAAAKPPPTPAKKPAKAKKKS